MPSSSTAGSSDIVWLGPDEIEPSGPILPVLCTEVPNLQVVDLRIHLRARGKSPAGNRDLLVERLLACLVEERASSVQLVDRVVSRGESQLPDPAHPVVEPLARVHSFDLHVGYVLGHPERDAAPGPQNSHDIDTCGRGRRSFPGEGPLRPPYSTATDLKVSAVALAEQYATGMVSPAKAAPFSSGGDPSALQFPTQRSQLPSAPPAPPADFAVQQQLASASKMSVQELREALRSRGLSPAGGGVVLQRRLSDSIQGLPLDVAQFECRDFGVELRSPPSTPTGKKGRRHFGQMESVSDLLG